jgi:hypothetical protein
MAYRVKWFCTLWNYLDLVVVSMALITMLFPQLLP